MINHMETDEILALDESEEIIVRTGKHRIGLIITYVTTGVSIAALLVILFFAVKNSDTIGVSKSVISVAALSLIALIALVGYISAYVYKRNELVVTNENIIQVLQYSLFNRQTSQLSLGKIQDVSVDQVGILSSLFKYGTIEIETAGEKSNFAFSFTPEPNQVAKTIIESHEEYLRTHSQNHNRI